MEKSCRIDSCLLTYSSVVKRRKPWPAFFIIAACLIKGAASGAPLEDLIAGGRAAGMGGAFVAVATGPESIFFNPAGTSQKGGIETLFFSSRPFGLKELSYHALSCTLPTRRGSFGLAFQTFGYQLYRENTLSLGWSNQYGETIRFGILTRFVQLAIPGYGTQTTLAFDAGCLIRLSPTLTWGVAGLNLNRTRMGQANNPLPQVIRMGVAFVGVKDLILSVEMDKDTRFPLELKGGLEWRSLKSLLLRCGFGRDPSLFSAGIGLVWKQVRCDIAVTVHPVLGTTHQGSLTVGLNRPAGTEQPIRK